MQRRTARLISAPCLLAGVAAVIIALPRSASIPEAGAVMRPPPATLTLIGIVRDFREWNVTGGHLDFDADGRTATWPAGGFAVYSGNVAGVLGADGLPVFTGSGFRVDSDWTTSGGDPICPTLFDAALGDVAGTTGPAGTGGVDSAASFDQWYRDVPGVNISGSVALRFELQADGSYLFDDELDPQYAGGDGFFPIDDRLFGNSPIKSGIDHNYHFTVQLVAQFVYTAGAGQTFEFEGDDDVFVFIDGKKVIDLGGVHSSARQVVPIDRLGLADGDSYTLRFFFAERNRFASNFRIRTNLSLESTMPLVLTEAFD